MNKEYILVNFSMDSKLCIEMLKVDGILNKIDELRIEIDNQNEKLELYKFMDFCNGKNIILINEKRWLSLILRLLYENKIYDNFKFRYFDLGIDNKKISILDRVKNIGIENMSFNRKIFRCLNYSKYLCDVMIGDNKYYGYVVDMGNNRYVSYYACLKELNGEYFSLDEIYLLKEHGGKIIMNVMYLCEESLSFVDYYSVLASKGLSKVSKDCNKLIKGIENFVDYYNKDMNLKLILWGKIDGLLEQYEIVDKDILDSFIEMIMLVKEPWDYFNLDDIRLLDCKESDII